VLFARACLCVNPLGPFLLITYRTVESDFSLCCYGGPFLRFLMLVRFWCALSLLPYHSGALVRPFSASLS
jgi:hypothetical protein